MNPNGVSYAVAYEGMFCANDEHVPGCPCQAGGDPVFRCYICERGTEDGDYINISRPDGNVARLCSVCYEKRDEDDVTVGLDYTEDEVLREGMPEFNGAFKSW
jgi:hypothetical protein